MTFAGLMSRWTIVVIVSCSSDIRPDAPPIASEPHLRSCSAILRSSCDSGFAACGIDGDCWCYVGPRMIDCGVPCPISPAPSCHAIGCDGFDTYECAVATGECWCVPKDGSERVRCELDGCG